MVEIAASIFTQMLQDLEREERVQTCEISELNNQVTEVVTGLQKFFEDGHNSEMYPRYSRVLRYIAYDFEDALETCAVEVAFMFQKHEERCIKRLVGRCIKRLVRRCICARNDGLDFANVRSQILHMKILLKCANERFPASVTENIRKGEEPSVAVDADGAVRWPRQMYPHGMEEHFVGRDDDLKQLVSLFVMEKEHRIISIWGIKGLGKTTIARKVCNHPEVRRRFEAFAWVSFNQESEIGDLRQDILRQLGPRYVKEIAGEENVINGLKEIQRERDCFIVLDSIWNIDQWNQISSTFEASTRILLTTREQDIADVGFAYQLRLFDEQEGWELLKKHAFPRENGPDFGMFPKLGKEMVRKCEYVPSVISSLGRNLTDKISIDEWQKANNDIVGHMQSDFHNREENIWSSKYDQLPNYSKQYFLYLGMFKANEGIDTEDLIFLWMGEGMVPSVYQETEGKMMDIAEDYLRKLAFSDMLHVQEDEFSVTRRFKVCCLHNSSRELSLYEGGKEHFGLEVMDLCDGKEPNSDRLTWGWRQRRFVIHFNKQTNFLADDPLCFLLAAEDYLRSLLVLNSDQRCVDIPWTTSDLGKLKLLRVLQFVRCKFEGRKLPKGVDKLVNLRYLGLLYCDLDELPQSISNLRNLHVLYIRVHDNSQISIPNVFSKMGHLKHLRLPDYSDRERMNKLILSDLLELETLIGFNSLIHNISGLSNLKKLRRLEAHAYSNNSITSIIEFVKNHGDCIRTNLYIENQCSFTSPEGLAILEEVLMCPNLPSLTLSMVLIYKFPDCKMHVSSDLTQLKLLGCKIKEDPMEALGRFPNLWKLCLGLGAFVGRELAVGRTGLKKLEYLEFRSLPNLEEWRVDEGAMPQLSALTIRRCPKLEKIPDALTSISTLKSMEIELAAKALADGREAEYRSKFAFVPSFVIRKFNPSSSS